MRYFTFTLFVFLSEFTFASSQNDSVALENDYVKVMRHSAISDIIENFSKRIIVSLEDTKIESKKINKLLKRGEVAVFQPGEKFNITKGDYFEVSIKKNHPEIKPMENWIEPLKNTTVYDDSELKIFEERLDAGDTRELHSHLQRVVVRLNNVQLTDPRTKPKGSPTGGFQIPNTVKFAQPVQHVVKNLSAIPLFNIVIEFKVKK